MEGGEQFLPIRKVEFLAFCFMYRNAFCRSIPILIVNGEKARITGLDFVTTTSAAIQFADRHNPIVFKF